MFGQKQALPVFVIAEADPADPLAAIRGQVDRNAMYNIASDYIINHALNQPAAPEPVAKPLVPDWRALLDQHIKQVFEDAPIRKVLPEGYVFEDTSDRIDEQSMAEFARELGIALGATSVKWVTYDDDGNPVVNDI